MNTGNASTALDDRTGDDTPPGISFTASANNFSDFAYRDLGFTTLAIARKCKRKRAPEQATP